MWAWSPVNNPVHKVCVRVCVCALSVYVRTYIPTYKQHTVQCGRPCCVDSHCNMVLVCWLGPHFVTDKSGGTL